MTATICPAILASNTDDFRQQMERVASFATRVHIDLADGQFAFAKTIAIDQVWWPGGVRADLHVMYRRPFEHARLFLDLGPQMVIVHAEAEGKFVLFAEFMHRHGVEVGVALKPETSVELIRPALDWIDHVLIFSGNLGHFGGTANLQLLQKVRALRQLKPQLEVGWDGGVNDHNAAQLAQGSVDVLNTGGFIQHASDPSQAFQLLQRQLQSV